MFSVATPAGHQQHLLSSIIMPGFTSCNMRYLDVELMRRYRVIYQTDVIHHVATLLMNKVLANGIRLHRVGVEAKPHVQAAYETAWLRFVRRVMESWWCFGFAAVTSERVDGDIGEMPIVLNPELLQVGFHEDCRGQRTWVFHELDVLNGLKVKWTDGRQAFEPIPNVHVFEYSPPSIDGTINSCISRIMPVFNQLIYATQADLTSALSNCSPSMWAQSRAKEKTPGTDLTGRGHASARASAVVPQSSTTVTGSSDEAGFIRDAVLQVRLLGAMDEGKEGPGTGGRASNLRQPVRVVRLPHGTEGSAFSAAPAPKYLPQYVERFEQSVANAFNVPVAIFSADKYLRQDRSSHRLQSGADAATLEDTVLGVQAALLDAVNKLAEHLYGDRFREEALLLSIWDPSYVSVAEAKPQVSWEFPVPVRVSIMRELYLEGSLRWDAYVDCVSQRHRIPLDKFEASPALTLHELHGIDIDNDSGKPNTNVKRKHE